MFAMFYRFVSMESDFRSTIIFFWQLVLKDYDFLLKRNEAKMAGSVLKETTLCNVYSKVFAQFVNLLTGLKNNNKLSYYRISLYIYVFRPKQQA